MHGYLKHHGIQGQKWGVQNGPPYPLSTTLAKKNSRVQHISVDKPRDPIGRMYVTYEPEDNEYYSSRHADWLIDNEHTDKVYKNEYTLIDDLRVPSRQTCVRAFTKMAQNGLINMGDFKQSVMDAYEDWHHGDFGKSMEADGYKFDKQSIDKTLLNENFINRYGFTIWCIDWLYHDDDYKNYIQSKGYNAMIDYEDYMTMKTKRPVIIFNAEKYLGKEYISSIIRGNDHE